MLDDVDTSAASPALARLEDQIAWYARRSRYNQRMFKLLKFWTIVVAASVPLLAAFNVRDARILASLTASIAIVEAVQQMNQYQTNWVQYRSTSEALKHEKFLYLSSAGPYSTTSDPNALLAERVEGLVSQEHAKWVSSRKEKKDMRE